MSTKQTNGRGFSVPRANRSGSSIAQRPPVNIANAKTSYEKYVTLARAAALSGDVVETENYYQHAEHYFRLMKDERIRRGQEEVDGAPGVEGNEQPS
jgi:hypothetical protein